MEITEMQKSMAQRRSGTLTIFAGYASGCGKTYGIEYNAHGIGHVVRRNKK